MQIRAYGDVSMYAIRTEYRDGYWFASHPELPGCKTHADSEWQAVANLADARAEYIATLIEDGLPVPQPNSDIGITS